MNLAFGECNRRRSFLKKKKLERRRDRHIQRLSCDRNIHLFKRLSEVHLPPSFLPPPDPDFLLLECPPSSELRALETSECTDYTVFSNAALSRLVHLPNYLRRIKPGSKSRRWSGRKDAAWACVPPEHSRGYFGFTERCSRSWYHSPRFDE